MPSANVPIHAVQVEVDRASWKAQPTKFRHPFPQALARQAGPFPVNLLEMLNRRGELTPPTLTSQIGVARLASPPMSAHHGRSTALKPRNEWRAVDLHRTGVASDNVGVGLATTVLALVFNYTAYPTVAISIIGWQSTVRKLPSAASRPKYEGLTVVPFLFFHCFAHVGSA